MPLYDHLIFLLLDGARPDVLGDLLNRGDLPHFASLFVENGTTTRAVTVFPSTTGTAYLPYLTGRYPGHCNIPGIRWFDRKRYDTERLSLSRFRSYIGASHALMGRDLSQEVTTLFEVMDRARNVFNVMNRGVGFLRDHGRYQKNVWALLSRLTDQWIWMDKWVGHQSRIALNSRPDFLFAAFPAVDEICHRSHPFSSKVLAAYRSFDQALGKLVWHARELGLFEKTLFVCASDHGLSATHTHFDLVSYLKDRGYSPLYHPLIFKRNVDSAVMVSGNGMAHLYVKGESSWEVRPKSEALRPLLDDLSGRPEIDFVATLTPEEEIYVRSKSAEGWIWEKDAHIHYKTVGGDPLGLGHAKSVMSDQESLQLTFNDRCPDAFRQLLQLFESDRTGDVVISAAPGYDLRLGYEWPEHLSSHGSLVAEHMLVPLALSHRLSLTRPVRSVDVYATLLSLMGKTTATPLDGSPLSWSLTGPIC